MKLSLKKALAALGVVACVAVPVFGETSWNSNAISGGGSYSTSSVTKKTSPTGAPALVQFTEFTNYDANPSAHPLALRVRTPGGAAATGVFSVYGTGTNTLYYNSGYGIYANDYVANVATHTASTRGASFAFYFTRKLSIKKKSLGLQISAGLSAIKKSGGNVYEKTNQYIYVSSNDERN